jgi:hypothetical protein
MIPQLIPPAPLRHFQVLPVSASKGRQQAKLQQIAQAAGRPWPQKFVEETALLAEVGAEVQEQGRATVLQQYLVAADAVGAVVEGESSRQNAAPLSSCKKIEKFCGPSPQLFDDLSPSGRLSATQTLHLLLEILGIFLYCSKTAVCLRKLSKFIRACARRRGPCIPSIN